VLLALAGCTGGHPTEPTPQAAETSAAAGGTPPSSPSTAAASEAPSPGSMARPASSAGPLTRASFPTPGQLGAGWEYTVDPGDAEEGYAGNGTPVLQRRPQEIVDTAVPFGCDRTRRMPLPRHALEVDYAYGGRKTIAVRSRFADEAAARAFFTARASNLRGCAGRSGSQAIGPLVATISRPAAGAMSSARTPESDPWQELAVVDGADVVLLAVQGDKALNRPLTRRIVTLFRR
jgi:hypothetical protein